MFQEVYAQIGLSYMSNEVYPNLSSMTTAHIVSSYIFLLVSGSIMFHVRRRPADCQPRRRKKKSGSIRAGGNANSMSGIPAGVLVELQSDGSQMDNGRTVCISSEVVEVRLSLELSISIIVFNND